MRGSSFEYAGSYERKRMENFMYDRCGQTVIILFR